MRSHPLSPPRIVDPDLIFSMFYMVYTSCGALYIESCTGATGALTIQVSIVHQSSVQLECLSLLTTLCGQTHWRLTSEVSPVGSVITGFIRFYYRSYKLHLTPKMNVLGSGGDFKPGFKRGHPQSETFHHVTPKMRTERLLICFNTWLFSETAVWISRVLPLS